VDGDDGSRELEHSDRAGTHAPRRYRNLYFMHVKYGTHLLWLFVAAGFIWSTVIMVVITMTDFATRTWL
jgi:hypothetical protein